MKCHVAPVEVDADAAAQLMEPVHGVPRFEDVVVDIGSTQEDVIENARQRAARRVLLQTGERLLHNVIAHRVTQEMRLALAALALNAAALIVYHNHPSGVPEPSSADRILTRRLHAACELVELRLLDHVVVATEGIVSFAARGWL